MIRTWQVVRNLGLAAACVACATTASGGPVTGSLSILVGGLPPITVNATGAGTSTAAGVSLDPSVFTATAATFPVATPFFTKVVLTAANGAGTFAGSPLNGPMAVSGRVRLLRGGATAFSIPLTASGTRGVGVGGAQVQVGTPASLLELTGGEWTTGWVAITGVGTGAAPRTVSLAGSDARTPNGAGTLTLVTPIRITHSSLGSLAAFGVLRLSFAPEPRAGALLLGSAALFGLGVRRSRRLR